MELCSRVGVGVLCQLYDDVEKYDSFRKGEKLEEATIPGYYLSQRNRGCISVRAISRDLFGEELFQLRKIQNMIFI